MFVRLTKLFFATVLFSLVPFQSSSVEITKQSFELKCNSWRPVASKKEDSKEQLTVLIWNHVDQQLKIYSSVIKEDKGLLIGGADSEFKGFSSQSMEDVGGRLVHMTYKNVNASSGSYYTEIRTFSFHFPDNVEHSAGVRASFMFGSNGIVQIGDDKILSDCKYIKS